MLGNGGEIKHRQQMHIGEAGRRKRLQMPHAIGLAFGKSQVLAAPLAADGGPTLRDCDRPDFQTVLQPLPDNTRVPARAHWLTGQIVQWPAIDAGGRFKLYYSARAQLVASVGRAVKGADGALSMDVFHGALPAAVAARFKFVAPGVLLAVRMRDRVRLRALHTQQLLLVQEDSSGRVLQVSALQAAGALDDLFASAQDVDDLGVSIRRGQTEFKLWAPTAQRV